MSGPLAIGAVSAVLRNILDNGVIDAGADLQSPVTVTAVAPDTINLANESGPRLNLFLYQVTPNPGWRNAGLPSRNGAGERITNPPLALDLHYLLTAYARDDFHAEVLLGYAMQILHEHPVLDRASIRSTLDPNPDFPSGVVLPPLFGALAASDLADQVEAIKITPAAMGGEELSKLWTAIQSHYRPSVGYHVSVVLIEAKQSSMNALPVLSRGITAQPDLGSPFPTLFKALPPKDQIAAKLGESITLSGIHLTSITNVSAVLTHRLTSKTINTVAVEADGKSATFSLPGVLSAEDDLPPGLWQVTLRVTSPPGIPPGSTTPVERETNAVSFAITPEPKLPPTPAPTRKPDGVEVLIEVRPHVRPQQHAELTIGAITAIAPERVLATDPLVFSFPSTLPSGVDQKVRLRVDGVDSRLVNRLEGEEPAFDASQVLSIPL